MENSNLAPNRLVYVQRRIRIICALYTVEPHSIIRRICQQSAN